VEFGGLASEESLCLVGRTVIHCYKLSSEELSVVSISNLTEICNAHGCPFGLLLEKKLNAQITSVE
jgi:hypothetical protein